MQTIKIIDEDMSIDISLKSIVQSIASHIDFDLNPDEIYSVEENCGSIHIECYDGSNWWMQIQKCEDF